MSEIAIARGGVLLAGEQDGGGQQGAATIVLLHGLTATRRYVVMGSRALERGGLRVISYDARGHGRSSPAPAREYGYEHLFGDLGAVIDAVGVERVILAGASMGAHTAARYAVEHPERVAALALITPAYDPARYGVGGFARWDALARGLREDGVEGFVRAYGVSALPERWRATVETVLRQRLSAHEHPDAVADALEVVPRSRPFEEFDELAAIEAPTIVVASRDEADPEHPLAIAELYAEAISGAELVVETEQHPPASPIAWQGGQLSRVLLELAGRALT